MKDRPVKGEKSEFRGDLPGERFDHKKRLLPAEQPEATA
jgi:hypothetical protein